MADTVSIQSEVGVEADGRLLQGLVGDDDTGVIEPNRAAMGQLRCEHELQIVPGAGHLFAKPGALQAVARIAEDWFRSHLVRTGTRA